MSTYYRICQTTWQGEHIEGVFLLAFIHNVDYHLTPIFIFQDGMIDCWGMVSFEEFKQKVRAGWIVTQPPADAKINVHSLAHFTVTNGVYEMEPEDFILEVADEIEALNRRPTSSKRCSKAWADYEAAPNGQNKEALRLAYEAVPRHNRKYILGDQDRKDAPIRSVLYPV